MNGFDRTKYVNGITSIRNSHKITGSVIMKENKEHVFPYNNWYIEITDENRRIVNDWKIKQEYNDDLFENLNYKYVYCDGSRLPAGCFSVVLLITTDQFKQYVLNQTSKSTEINDNEHLVRLLKEISLT